jgi:signal transduction histidine kinase
MVRIDLNLEADQLMLRVQDNGKGKSPELWAHGLGLSGVRKRVKQLGGSVEWRSLPESGIVCQIKMTLSR